MLLAVEDAAAGGGQPLSGDGEVRFEAPGVRGLRRSLRDVVSGGRAATPSAAAPGRDHRQRPGEHEPAHQYVRSIGCHLVTVTGFHPSRGAPFSMVTTVWRM